MDNMKFQFASPIFMIIFLATSFSYAKDRFVPAIQVDDMVITQYEIDQRTAFFDLLNFPGDHKNLAKKSLIDDRLKKEPLKNWA